MSDNIMYISVCFSDVYELYNHKAPSLGHYLISFSIQDFLNLNFIFIPNIKSLAIYELKACQ